ncbi:MAG: Ig-like domain-containing protein [Arachnia sp.]
MAEGTMPEETPGRRTPSRTVRRVRRFLGRSWQALVVGAVVIALGVLAFLSPGLVQADVRLDEGTVHVVKRDDGRLGVLNAQIDAIAAQTAVGDSAFRILQDKELVLVHGTASSTLGEYEPARNRLKSPKQLPGGAKVQLGGGTLLVVTPDNGKVWFGEPRSLLEINFQEQKAQLEVGDFGTATTTAAGDVIGLDIQRSVLVRPGAEAPLETPLPFTLDPDRLDIDISAVGDKAVVLDRGTGRIWVEGMDQPFEVSGAKEAKLLPPAPDALNGRDGARALYATRAGLIALTVDGPRSLTGNLDAAPVEPVQVNGCVYSAFGSQFMKLCRSGDPDFVEIPGVPTDADRALAFQVNRDTVVLNDLNTGVAWMVDKGMTPVTWDNVLPPEDADDDAGTRTETVIPPDREQANRDPIAKDDELAARAGRSTILTVLDNDSDPDGDVLTITPLSEASGVTLQPVRGGSGLQVTVDSAATGSVTFSYKIEDGRGGKATADVTLRILSADAAVDNGPPAMHNRAQPATIGLGKKINKRVLMDWRDPDGDSLILVDASLPKDSSDEVSFTPDGEVTFRDVGISTGTKKVKITVSDGFVESDGEMVVSVTDDVVAPIAYGDFETMAMGTTITVRPLANDVGESLSLTEVVAEKPAECKCTIKPNYQEQLFDFTPTHTGIHYITYKVSNGPVALGLVRIDVRKQATNTAPVAALDVALLPPGGSVMIDPVLNDTDDDGDVLVVQSVSQHPGLRVTLERRHLVTIETIHAPEGPVTLTYRLSDGRFSVLGTITVLPTSSTGSPQPQATRDTVSIRAGTTQTIDVLANDTSPVGLPLKLDKLVENPLRGRAWIHGDRIRVAVPASTQTGSIRLTYQVSDTEGRITSAELVVTVVSEDAQNLPPQPRGVEERVLAGTTSRLLVPTDGIDPNGDAVRLVGLGSGPRLGRVTDVGDGWISYEAYTESKGTDVFAYRVIDASGAVGEGEMRVGVASAGPDNIAPTGVPDAIEVRPGRPVQIPALRNDVDIDGDTIGFVTEDPVEIEGIDDVEIIENREISFVAPLEEGTYLGTYWIQDVRGERGSGDLRITVDAKADLLPPEARDDVVPVSAVAGEEWVEVDVTANDFDPDGRQEDLRVEVPDYGASEESAASASKDGRKVTVPVTEQMQQIRYDLLDADGRTDTGLIIVPGRNDSVPVLKDPSVTLEETAGQTLSININDYVAGTANRAVRLPGVDSVSATHGQVLPGAERIEYTPDLAYEGPASIVFKVSDVTTEDDTPKEAYISIPVTVLPAPNKAKDEKGKDLTVARSAPELINQGMPTLRVGPGEGDARLDLLPLFRDPDGDAFFFRNFQHVSGDKSIEFQESGDSSKLLARAPINAKPGTVRILQADVVDANEGRLTFQIRLEVVSSTRPLASTGADTSEARAGKEVVLPVLANDKSNLLEKPQLTLTPDASIVTGSGTIRVEGDLVKITPAAEFVGTLTARYTVMDATEDPNRRVDGTIRLTVKARPSRPGVPRDGVAGNGTVTFTYTPGSSNGLEITRRTAVAIAADGRELGATQCQSTTCTVTGLPNGKPYQFTVTETNDEGDSDPSLPSAAYTPDVKPNAPAKPGIAFGDGQLTATWQAPTWANPSNPGSRVDRYNLVLLDEAGAQVGAKKLTDGTTTHVWTGLENGRRYRFKVSAGNLAGDSTWSEMSVVNWPAAPPAASPTINATATENPLGGAFDVAWASAGINDNGDPVKEFIVTPVTQQGPQTQLARTVAATGAATQTVRVEGLGQRPYKFTVVATNKAGPGAAATTAQWQTAWELPRIEAFSATASNATIQMGVRTNYEGRADANPRIQYSLGGGEWRPYPSAGRATGLTNGQVYDVAVRVVIDGDKASASQSVSGLMPRADGPTWSTLDESSFAFQGIVNGAPQVYVKMEKPSTLVASGGWNPMGYWYSCGGNGVYCSPSGTTRSNDFIVSSSTLRKAPVDVSITMGHQDVKGSTTSSEFTLKAPFVGSWNSTTGALNVQLSYVRSATCRVTGDNIDKSWSQGGATSLVVSEVFPVAEGLILPPTVNVTCTFGNNRSATVELGG